MLNSIPKDKKYNIFGMDFIEEAALEQFAKAMQLPCNLEGALMPDSHSGYTLPIGAVIKSKEMVFPAYVGYDIGCGMCAIKTDLERKYLNDLELLRDTIIKRIPLGKAKHKSRQKLDKEYRGATEATDKIFRAECDYNVGTLGGGNHFIEVGVGQDDYIWVVIHSGSRGVGKKIAEFYMRLARYKDIDFTALRAEIDADPAHNDIRKYNPEAYEKLKTKIVKEKVSELLKNIEEHYGFNINSEEGKNYLADMNTALEFALENRKKMAHAVLGALEIASGGAVYETVFINRNHNHAEVKEGGFVIHRKGATHAEKDMLGVIPANMRDGSFIVKGLGNSDSLCSSSHGAGRVLSRKQAKENLNYDEFVSQMQGIVTNHSEATLDEAPNAYKDINMVMELQKDLVEIVDVVKPILNIKG